jgi:hypothetical protein
MYGAIFGFHRDTRHPKCAPDSMRSLTLTVFIEEEGLWATDRPETRRPWRASTRGGGGDANRSSLPLDADHPNVRTPGPDAGLAARVRSRLDARRTRPA